MAAVVTANQLNYVMLQALLDQTMDATLVAGKKWFSLQDNKLDGTYYPVDSSAVLQVGWWGTTLSAAGGALSPSPVLTITETRSIHSLQVNGDNLLGEYPVDFVIRLYNGAALLYTETVVANAAVQWKKNLAQAYDVTKIEISVSKLNKVGRVVKILNSFSPFEIVRVDTLLPKSVDTSLAGISIQTTDTLKPKIAETDLHTVQVNRTDTLTPKTVDVSFFTSLEIWRTDILKPKTADVSTPVTNSFNRPDTLLPKTADTDEITAQINRADTLLPKTADVSTPVTNSFNRPDTLLPKTADVSTPVTNSFNRLDTLLPKTADVSTPVTNSFSSTDILKPNVTEVKAIQVNLYSNELIIVSGNIEVDEITAEIYSGDTILVTMNEAKLMNNVYVAMDSDTRQIYGKLEVTYTDPFSDESIQVIASETGKDTYADEAVDNITEPKYKWFSLHDNKLDGSFHPLPSAREYSVGWWSTSLSDLDGSFSNAPTISVIFDARSLLTLKVVGDSLLDAYPVDFTITAYNAANDVLHTENIVGNTEVNWNKAITPILSVTKLVLAISKINKAYSAAKVTEFYSAVVETYVEDKIESFNILEEIGYNSGSLPIGNISANELDVSLDNADKRFDISNNQSTLFGLLKKNRRIRVFLGVEIIEGVIEWYPFGVFWTTSWNVPKNSLVAYTTARDRLELLRFTDFINSRLYTNWALYSLFELVLTDAGLTVDDYELDVALQDITLPYAWFDRMSHRDALQELTKCSLVQVFCDKVGKIVVRYSIQPTANVMYTFDEDKNIFNTTQPLAWADVVNYVEVVSKTYAEDIESSLCKDDTSFSIPASSSVDLTYTFSSIPAVSITNIVLAADVGISVTHTELYAWGAVVTLSNSAVASKTVTSIEIFGTALKEIGKNVQLAKDDIAIRDDGKIKITIEHPFIQSTPYALMLATDILGTYKNSRYDVVLDNRGCIALRLGDNTGLKDTNENTADSYMVSRQNVTWNGFLSAVTEGKKY